MSTIERTPTQKKIDKVVLERVKRGLAWLEETHGPGWEDHIDLKTLDLRLGDACVLGQVFAEEAAKAGDGYSDTDYDGYNDVDQYDGYSYASEKLFPYGVDDGEYGFDLVRTEGEDYRASWSKLQDAWEYVLTPMVEKP